MAKGITVCFVEYKDDVSPVVRMAWYDVVPPMAQPPAADSSSSPSVPTPQSPAISSYGLRPQLARE